MRCGHIACNLKNRSYPLPGTPSHLVCREHQTKRSASDARLTSGTLDLIFIHSEEEDCKKKHVDFCCLIVHMSRMSEGASTHFVSDTYGSEMTNSFIPWFPKLRDTARMPNTRFLITKPPAASTLSCSDTSSALWSYVNRSAFPPRARTARLFKKPATEGREGVRVTFQYLPIVACLDDTNS